MNRKIHPDITSSNLAPIARSNNDVSTTIKNGGANSISITNRDGHSIKQITPPELFKRHCHMFHDQVVQIQNTRIVEKLGSIITKSEKQEELKKFDILFKSFILNIQQLQEIIQQVDYSLEFKTAKGVPIVEQFPKDIKYIQNCFVGLVTQSSLRFMHKCTEIYDLDEYDIDLEYDIQKWYTTNRDHIQKYAKKNKKKNESEKQSFCESICSCFLSNDYQTNRKDSVRNLSQSSLKKKM